jgi:hypothetical protein
MRSDMMGNSYNIDELLSEIKDLAEIPEFAGSIKHKIEELKAALSENIHLHREIENMIYDNDIENEKPFQIKGQRFELTLIGKELWIPSIPINSKKMNIYTIIPKEVIKYIIDQESEKGFIEMRRGLTIPALKDRKFDLCFEKITGKYYIGVINEIGGVKIQYPDSINEYGEVNLEDMKLLFKYFKSFPFYFERVFKNFKQVWRKGLDKRAIEGK